MFVYMERADSLWLLYQDKVENVAMLVGRLRDHLMKAEALQCLLKCGGC
jgi:hypothetical protein